MKCQKYFRSQYLLPALFHSAATAQLCVISFNTASSQRPPQLSVRVVNYILSSPSSLS